MVRIGNTKLNNFKVGNIQVKKIMQGSNQLIWELKKHFMDKFVSQNYNMDDLMSRKDIRTSETYTDGGSGFDNNNYFHYPLYGVIFEFKRKDEYDSDEYYIGGVRYKENGEVKYKGLLSLSAPYYTRTILKRGWGVYDLGNNYVLMMAQGFPINERYVYRVYKVLDNGLVEFVRDANEIKVGSYIKDVIYCRGRIIMTYGSYVVTYNFSNGYFTNKRIFQLRNTEYESDVLYALNTDEIIVAQQNDFGTKYLTKLNVYNSNEENPNYGFLLDNEEIFIYGGLLESEQNRNSLGETRDDYRKGSSMLGITKYKVGDYLVENAHSSNGTYVYIKKYLTGETIKEYHVGKVDDYTVNMIPANGFILLTRNPTNYRTPTITILNL